MDRRKSEVERQKIGHSRSLKEDSKALKRSTARQI